MFGETRNFTDQEICAILSRTRIPTLVIEGKHDLFLFRRLQEEIGPSNISIFPVGGKTRVISAFRSQTPATGTTSLLFFVDKDEWTFCAIPAEFDVENFETTDGYSIENDLVHDGNILNLMTAEEHAVFKSDMDKFVLWFSIQMARYLNGAPCNLKKFVGQVLDSEIEYQADCALAVGEVVPEEVSQLVSDDPVKRIRGKSLLQIISRQLNAVGRVARHQPNALLETGAAAKGPHYQRILNWVSSNLEREAQLA